MESSRRAINTCVHAAVISRSYRRTQESQGLARGDKNEVSSERAGSYRQWAVDEDDERDYSISMQSNGGQ